MKNKFDVEIFVDELAYASTRSEVREIVVQLDTVDKPTRILAIDALEKDIISSWNAAYSLNKENMLKDIQEMRSMKADSDRMESFFSMMEVVSLVSKEKGDAVDPVIKAVSSVMEAMSDAEFSSAEGAVKGLTAIFKAVGKISLAEETPGAAEVPVYKNPFRKDGPKA